ncbi:MAG TPA: hypothetical protein VKY74_07405 [Chloroflexia bacterium]|nr:hypothetical protein [Chloroflexia bacterium]
MSVLRQKPAVLMSASAYTAACAEFEHWAAHGRRHGGSAWEAVVYPLVGLVPRPGAGRSPLEPTPLAACAALVVPRVVLPPAALAHYGPTWARPGDAAAPAGAADELQARLAAGRAPHPRLDCYGRLHSHPWPHAHPHLSGTDCAEHLSGALAGNGAAGLPWALGLVAAAPRPGDPGTWPIQAYGLRAGGALVDLGGVTIASDADPRVRWVLGRAGWATPAGARWRARQIVTLAARGMPAAGHPLHRGWYGLAIRRPNRPVCLVALPPGFPAQPPRLLRPAAGGGWMGIAGPPALPRWSAYHLVEYVARAEARR